MISDPLFYFVAFFAVVFVGLAKGGFAGAGMAAAPLLALVVPPMQAAAILLPILLLQDAISVWVYRRDWDAWNLKVLLPGSILGVAAAWAVAAYVDESQLRLALGVITLSFVLHRWLGDGVAVARRPSAFLGFLCGAGSGFTSTFAHAGAPPFHIHMIPQRLDRVTFAATGAIFFAAVNFMKVAPFFALGQLSADNLATSAMLFPLAIVTNFFGIWLVRVIPQELFYKAIYLIVFVVSLELIRAGLVGIMAG